MWKVNGGVGWGRESRAECSGAEQDCRMRAYYAGPNDEVLFSPMLITPGPLLLLHNKLPQCLAA